MKPLSSQQLFFLRSSCSPHFFDLSEMKPKKKSPLSLSFQAFPLAPHQAPKPRKEDPAVRGRREQLPIRRWKPPWERRRRRRRGDGDDRPRRAEAAARDSPASAPAARVEAHRRPPPDPEASPVVRVWSPSLVPSSRRRRCRFVVGQGQDRDQKSDPPPAAPAPVLCLPGDPGGEPRHPFQERVGASRGGE